MSSPPSSTTPNLEFTKINPFISLYTPPPIANPSKTDPTTILLCSWMGASPRSRALHVAFHKYHSLYPSARIILVRSPPEWFLTTPSSTRLKLLTPVLSAIKADPSGSNERILLHLFSNGGGVATHDICTLYKQHFGKVFHVKAMVLDSAPGNPSVMEGWAAFKVGLPKGVLWYPLAASMWVALGVMWVPSRVLGVKSMIDVMREGFLDFEVMDIEAKRLYVYSDADELVVAKGVDEEVEKARVKGVVVKVLKEGEIPHVQHMLLDAERYWRHVEELWESTK